MVLGYTFLAGNTATINFKTRELRLRGMSAHCLSSQTKESDPTSENANGVKNAINVAGRWGLLSAKECRLWPEETHVIDLKACSDEWIRRQVEKRKSVALECGLIK